MQKSVNILSKTVLFSNFNFPLQSVVSNQHSIQSFHNACFIITYEDNKYSPKNSNQVTYMYFLCSFTFIYIASKRGNVYSVFFMEFNPCICIIYSHWVKLYGKKSQVKLVRMKILLYWSQRNIIVLYKYYAYIN